MKLIEALDPVYNLLEGVKFTTAQIQDVKRRAHQIYVSVEYEYYVDEEHASGESGDFSEDIWERANEQAQQEFEDNRREWINDVWNEEGLEEIAESYWSLNRYLHENAAQFGRLYKAISDRNDFEEWEEMLNTNNEDYNDNREEARKVIINLIGLPSSTYELNEDFDEEYEELLNYTRPADHGLFEPEELHKIAQFVINASMRGYDLSKKMKLSDHDILSNLEFLCNNESEIDEIDTYIDRVNDLTMTMRSFTEQIEGEFKDSMREVYEHNMGMDEDDWVIAQAEELINNGEFEDHEDNKDSGIDFSFKALQKHDNQWHIDYNKEISVIEEEARKNQLELKTKTQPIDQALETMAKIFDFIEDIGHTDSSCGMHVNMSFKNEQFVPENFDPIKLVMLMGTNETIERFPVRNYVKDILKTVKDENTLLDLAHCRISKTDKRNLLLAFSHTISKSYKFQTINFDHLYSRQQDNKRIEFRYPGGKNYEKRLNEFQVELYKQAYMLEAAFNPDFLYKEYLKRVIKVLDQAVNKRTIRLIDKKGSGSSVIVEEQTLTHFVDLQEYVQKYDKLIDEGHATHYILN